MNKVLWGLSLALSAVLVTINSYGQSPLPFESGFEADEGYSPGPLPTGSFWVVEGAVAVAGDHAQEGEQSVRLDPGNPSPRLSGRFLPPGSAVVFVDYFARPSSAAQPLPEGSTLQNVAAVTAVLEENGQGILHVYQGGDSENAVWLPTGVTLALENGQATQWYRFTFRLDYTRGSYDLYVNEQLVAVDLTFADPSLSTFTRFDHLPLGQSASWLDFFYAGTENPLFADTGGDGIPDAWKQQHGLVGSAAGRYADPDKDGLPNIFEYLFGTDPNNPDSSGDGVFDGKKWQADEDPAVPQSYALGTLPFTETFEGYSPGDWTQWGLWQVSGTEVPLIHSETVREGQQALLMEAGEDMMEVSHAFSADPYAPVWVDFYLRAAALLEVPPLALHTSAAFHFGDDGLLRVFNGSGEGGGTWLTLEHPPVSPSDWVRVTLKLDYASQRWSIWLNGVRYGQGLGFAYPVPFFSNLSFTGKEGTRTYLDDLRITYSESPGLDNDGDGLTNDQERALGTDPDLPDTSGDGIGDYMAVLLGLDPLVQDSVAKLTEGSGGELFWGSGFENSEGYQTGSLHGQQNWSAQGSAAVEAGQGKDSPNALVLSTPAGGENGSAATLMVGAVEAARIWISFDGKLLAGALPVPGELEGPTSALFGVDSRGHLSAYDAAAARWIQSEVKPAEGWQDYALYLDYETKRWMLCLNGVIVLRDLGFTDPNIPHFSRLRIGQSPGEEAAATLIDNVVISTEEPPEMDFDGDGLPNWLERELGTDPFKADTSGDGVPDGWLHAHGLNPLVKTGHLDLDGDGLTVLQEYQLGTDPLNGDTDGDGVGDHFEIIRGTDPLIFDHDMVTGPLFPWSFKGIGSADGDALYVNGEYVILANGSGYSGHANDSVGFLYKEITGDFEFVARVKLPPQATNLWRGGLIVRTSLHAKSPMSAIFLGGNRVIYHHDRQELNGKTGTVSDSIIKSSNPCWIKVKRQGNLITQFTSEDGQNWSLFYNTSLVLPETLLVGMGVVSGNSEQYAGGLFDQLAFDLDEDGDGLLDSEETRWQTSDQTSDSDGDGISDWREVYEFFSDPAVADLGPSETVLEKRGRILADDSGEWIGYGNGKYVNSINGSLATSIEVTQAGILELDLEAGFRVNDTADPRFGVDVEVNGQYVGKLLYDIEGTGNHSARILLPWLNPGSHQVRLTIDNDYLFRKIQVERLRLNRIGGLDENANGIPDWMENRLKVLNGLEHAVIQSRTSPVCLVGKSRFPAMVMVAESGVNPGPNDRWYLDLPLPEEESVSVPVSFENGGLIEEAILSWVTSNPFKDGTIQIRPGDALKLQALPEEGEGQIPAIIKVNGIIIGSVMAEDAVIHDFVEPGQYVVHALYDPNGQMQEASMLVDVLEASPGPSPLAVHQQTRRWDGAKLPAGTVMDFDQRMVSVLHSQSGDQKNYAIRIDTTRDRHVWARLGEEGPVLAAERIRGLKVSTLISSGMMLEESYAEGITSVLMPVVVSRLDEDMRITLEVTVSGVLFDDGSLVKELHASDFSENGVAYIRFLKSPGRSATCHRTRVYQNSYYIGRNQ